MIPTVERTSGTARLDDRGRVVLPADFRRGLGLRPGDEVRMTVESDGVLRVEGRRAAAHALIGMAGASPRASLSGSRSGIARVLRSPSA